MDNQRVGTVLRAIRIRRGWRQEDVALAAGVSSWTVSRIERGRLGSVDLARLQRVAEAVDARLDIQVRWQGGELDRLINARHSAMHEAVARLIVAIGSWEVVPEVSFSIYGERGVIDLLAWQAGARVLLVIELKTELADLQAMVGTVDRYRRLAPRVVAERGWIPQQVALWVLIAEGRTNRRRVAQHATMLRMAFPDDGRAVMAWLRHPSGRLAALSFLPNERGVRPRTSLATPKRVPARNQPRRAP
jgi:transcriptional regulator with XRE-family HTH domain